MGSTHKTYMECFFFFTTADFVFLCTNLRSPPNHHVVTSQWKAREQWRKNATPSFRFNFQAVCFLVHVSVYHRFQEVSIRTFFSWLMCGIGGEVPGRLCVPLIFTGGCTLHLLPLQIPAGWPSRFGTLVSFMFVSCSRRAFEVSQ